MDFVIGSLCDLLGLNVLWYAMQPLVPLLGIATLFALGSYLIYRIAHTIQVIREDPDMYDRYVAYKCKRYNKKHGIY